MINVKALAPLIPLLLAAEPSWEKVVEKRGVVVSKKQRKGSVINEVRATGVFDAPPHEVWKVLADLERYPEFMPYTAEVSVLERSDDGRTQVAYERLDIPFAAQRDYLLVVRDESTPEFLKLAWRCAAPEQDTLKPVKPGLVRIRLLDGSWTLEANAEGTKTWATYWLYTDPGGYVPAFIANTANVDGVPQLFEAVRGRLVKPRQGG